MPGVDINNLHLVFEVILCTEKGRIASISSSARNKHSSTILPKGIPNTGVFPFARHNSL